MFDTLFPLQTLEITRVTDDHGFGHGTATLFQQRQGFSISRFSCLIFVQIADGTQAAPTPIHSIGGPEIVTFNLSIDTGVGSEIFIGVQVQYHRMMRQSQVDK